MTKSRTPPPVPASDDAALFRDAVGPVRELKAATPPPAPPKPKPRARMAELDESDARLAFRRGHGVPPLESGDLLSYRRDGVPARSWQRLRRGEIPEKEELDLHGADVHIAEAMLRTFVNDALRHGLGCVRVIHGKGLHGDGAPVLKNLVDRLLRHRADVVAFHSAPPAQGGTGAVLVLLAPPRRR